MFMPQVWNEFPFWLDVEVCGYGFIELLALEKLLVLILNYGLFEDFISLVFFFFHNSGSMISLVVDCIIKC